MSIWTRAYRKVRRTLGRDPRLDLIDECAAGRLPITIAWMDLSARSSGPAEAEGLIARALDSRKPGSPARERLRGLKELSQRHPNAHEIARRMAALVTTRPDGMSEADYWAAEFDRAVAVSSEASVALYSFGDPLLLRQITEELVGKLIEWEVLRRDSRVLDYGCGIGRVSEQLATHAAEVVAVDVSAGMLGVARTRLAGISNVRLEHAQTLLADKSDTGFDLILLIDVAPYLSDVTPLLTELLSRLASGASLIVMNWSYDLRLAEQRARARVFARQNELVIVSNGTAEFSLWDGLVFHFRKPARPEPARAR
jgi:2-polyprenyl-3-methyl-5-hydroxy-6-metoxy-1,4-benzoquinol methylase